MPMAGGTSWLLILLLPQCSAADRGSRLDTAGAANGLSVLWNEFWLQDCNASGFPLGSFGIRANARNAQNGAVVSILGSGSIQGQHRLGPFMDWPKIEKDGSVVNGGLPARANLSTAMVRIEAALSMLPDGFSGALYFDMEAWDPLWALTAPQYRNASVAWVLKRQPGLSAAAAAKEAQRQYEAAAKRWMLAPLEAALRAHPRALVGYYNYPKCAPGMECEQMPPETNITAANDQLAWLWDTSTALFPTIYYDFVWHKGSGPIVHESRRLAGERSGKQVLPVWWYYGCGSYSEFCSESNQRQQWQEAVAAGCDGFVVWGGGKATPRGCRAFEHYVSTVLGPVAKNITSAQAA
jgi:hyaluronoglucosaminidase